MTGAYFQRVWHQRSHNNALRSATLFVVFVCLVLLATNAALIMRARTYEIAQISLANANLARAVTQQIESSLAEVDHVLGSIVFGLERIDMTPDALQRMQPTLVNHVAAIEQLKGLFIFDAMGQWIVHTEAVSSALLNNADRAYFIFHRDNLSARTLISAPIQSRSSGEWIIPISRRVNDPDGRFAGVALATLSIPRFREFLERFDIGSSGAIAVSLAGVLLVRRPDRVDDLGKRTAGISSLRAIFDAEKSGSLDARSTLDGVQRIIGFDHTKNYPVLVTVAVGRDEALQDWRINSAYQTALVAFLCLIVVAAGALVVHAIRQRISVETGLRNTRDALTLANERLEYLAQYDALTGLPNRRYFDSHLARLFRQAQRDERPMAIIMVDVDNFKSFNDRYGHVEGDRCLQRVSDSLISVMRRPGDFAARYGGEEMAVLLPATDVDGAIIVAEAARRAVLALDIPHASTSLGCVSICLGIAGGVPDHLAAAEQMLKAADAALYRAKHRGKNQVAT